MCEIERIVLEVRQVDSTEYVGSSLPLFCDPLLDLLNYAKTSSFMAVSSGHVLIPD